MEYDVTLKRTDRGRRIEISREVPAPAATIWETLTDVNQWEDWGPPVTDVDYPDRTVTAGTSGRVQAFGLLWVPFRIESVADANWTWTVWGFMPPCDGHLAEDVGDQRCRAALELPLWAPWYLVICWLALRNLASIAEAASR